MFYKNKKIIKYDAGFTRTPKTWVSGFTLLELLVVITIATIITTAFIIKNQEWNKNFAVTSQIYDLALTIRQAQTYSLGVKEDVSGSADKFNVSYGVHADFAVPGQFIMFADRNLNGIYDNGEGIETKTLKRGVQIVSICGNRSNGATFCSESNPGSTVTGKVNITFKRPETKALVTFQEPDGDIASGFDNSYALVSLTVSPVRYYRLTVSENKISINRPPPPPRSR